MEDNNTTERNMTDHQEYLGKLAGSHGFTWVPSHRDIHTIAVEVHWVNAATGEAGSIMEHCNTLRGLRAIMGY